ncbi:4-hydroxy-3-methylbut-2-enyl diphosphate reductase [Amycolatopsis rubida]|uniref:4-hydroxy-3-methylbut-2-enyl diphosphate reductase n=1 Tax=Amycolatopsis rubida TaxID=112413 RepID=A0ABX0BP45_9PSEU|nr:4-hydroxy-3-methylbut-2-enyl diphosphate reductase [Amycolatopsis sp. M39]MYW89637.1 4-hydroxy-3-methylbut-2-enyl diphosphate reductase [Amycolatopsis rubida]NEC54613.1 4-hydroxy-3-methylbut-2-enyl diphosphate reductase [Amycolatopsis rubida]OAP23584.1 4-hydroxy-3-methylbut-2-enyl diphosphate reductase [Amycolatopsis sp. M39]
MTPIVCTPLRIEQAALRGPGPRTVHTGLGPRRAVAAATRLPSGPRIVAGIGGGLSPEVRPGDMVVATEVRGPSGAVPVPSAPLLAGALRRLGLTVHLGPVVGSSHVVRERERASLASSGALAVDMESAWLAAKGEPFAVVRAIVDTVGEPLLHPSTVANGLAGLRSLRRAAPAITAWAEAVGPRTVLLASPRSFCAGVERAIEIVERALEKHGAPVYVRRQIVHNTHVVHRLQGRGAVFVDEVEEVPEGATLVFAAHGVSPAVRRAAADRGLSVVDATCPLVTKVHNEVRRYTGRGETVFLIGHAEHEEVEGTVGEAPGNVVVVGDVAAARTVTVRDPSRTAYTMQTTLALDEAEEIASVLRERFPGLSAPRKDDICYATTNRQQALRAIAREVDLVLVVGSGNSSNSRRLVEVAEREGTPAVLVDGCGDVDLRRLAGAGRIGLTAGASAPPRLVSETVGALRGLGPVSVTENTLTEEEMTFTLPREVL